LQTKNGKFSGRKTGDSHSNAGREGGRIQGEGQGEKVSGVRSCTKNERGKNIVAYDRPSGNGGNLQGKSKCEAKKGGKDRK